MTKHLKVTDAFLDQFGDHELVKCVRNQRVQIAQLELKALQSEKQVRDLARENEKLKRENSELKSRGSA